MVVYKNQLSIIWETNTSGQGQRFAMETSGNLVLYDGRQRVLFQSNTSGRGDYLSVGDDGSLSVYDSNDTEVWTTGANLCKTLNDSFSIIKTNFLNKNSLDLKDRLNRGEQLRSGDKLVSRNGKFTFEFQSGFLFVLFRGFTIFLIGSTLFSLPADRFVLQDDGYPVLYDTNNSTLWRFDTKGRGDYLVLRNDGNLVLYDKYGSDVMDFQTYLSKNPLFSHLKNIKPSIV